MTPTEIEIAKRFVACKSWQWKSGMLVDSDPPESLPGLWRIVGDDEFSLAIYENPWTSFCGESRDDWTADDMTRAIPVVTDRATQGAILGLVLDKLWVRFCGLDDRGTFWEVRTLTGLPKHSRNVSYEGPTMVEALLAVLEAP
jgi:hypothetical protein